MKKSTLLAPLLILPMLCWGCSEKKAPSAEPTLKFEKTQAFEKMRALSSPESSSELKAFKVSNTAFHGGGRTSKEYAFFRSPDLGKNWTEMDYRINGTGDTYRENLSDLVLTKSGWHASSITKGVKPGVISFGKTGLGTYKRMKKKWKNNFGSFFAGGGETLVLGHVDEGAFQMWVSKDQGANWRQMEVKPEFSGQKVRLSTSRKDRNLIDAEIGPDGEIHLLGRVRPEKSSKPGAAFHLEIKDGKPGTVNFFENPAHSSELFQTDDGLLAFTLHDSPPRVATHTYSFQSKTWKTGANIPLVALPDGRDRSESGAMDIDVSGDVQVISYVALEDKDRRLLVTYSLDGGKSWTPSESLGDYNETTFCHATPKGIVVKGVNKGKRKSDFFIAERS